MNNLWSKKWGDIIKEAEKCQLLCSNCHCEIEQAISYNESIMFKVLGAEFFVEIQNILQNKQMFNPEQLK